jgi:hypothetical protein
MTFPAQCQLTVVVLIVSNELPFMASCYRSSATGWRATIQLYGFRPIRAVKLNTWRVPLHRPLSSTETIGVLVYTRVLGFADNQLARRIPVQWSVDMVCYLPVGTRCSSS